MIIFSRNRNLGDVTIPKVNVVPILLVDTVKYLGIPRL